MEDKEVFFTNDSEVRNWESGEVFRATSNESYRDNIRFTVSSAYIIERNIDYVIIDTSNDADL